MTLLMLSADHIEHIAKLVGKGHVGIGSDFDGILSTPLGLEDASKYPDVVSSRGGHVIVFS